MENKTVPPLVSIITVNYNTDKVTAELLHSLRLVTYPNLEIIVIDNASITDCSYLAALFPEIVFIQNAVNEGFAGGNNRGIEKASGEIIFLLNNDTEVDAMFIEPAVELFNANAEIGIISPKIKYFFSDNLIQYAGGEPINQFTARGKFIGTGQPDTGQFDIAMQTHLAHGAAMAIHRRVFEKIGLLPEKFFLYYEELDFSEHAQRAGFTIWYQPKSVVLHKESTSVGKLSMIKTYYQHRNRLLFIRRNSFGMKKVISIAFFVFVSTPASLLKYLAAGQTAFASQIWKSLIWNLHNTCH